MARASSPRCRPRWRPLSAAEGAGPVDPSTGGRVGSRSRQHGHTPRKLRAVDESYPPFTCVVTPATIWHVTDDTHEETGWVLLTYRVPPEPSRHRVAVWRELRKVGAVALKQATWVLPAKRDFMDALTRAVTLVERGGGEALVLDVIGRDEATMGRLEAMFTEAREGEWTEFLSEC